MTRILPARLKRRVAGWALRHLEPERGEWRRMSGAHWRLVAASTHLELGARASTMELHYVQAIDYPEEAR